MCSIDHANRSLGPRKEARCSIAHPAPAGASRPTLVLTAAELKRAAAEAVAEGGARGALLSQPVDGEQK